MGHNIMGVKKTKLFVPYEYEFDLIGITTTVKEYKLAWSINNLLNIRLVKDKDLEIAFKNDTFVVISNFIYETENSVLRLLKNKSFGQGAGSHGYLVPELKDFDYIVLISGFEDTFSTEELIQKFRTLSEIDFLQKINVDQLKSRENLIF